MSQIYCQICGVSFSIRRRKRPEEPKGRNQIFQEQFQEKIGRRLCEPQFAGRALSSSHHPRGSLEAIDLGDLDLNGLVEKCLSLGERYDGFNISAEEFSKCNTMQCLVRFDPQIPWTTGPDDEAFERPTGFFLSGLVDVDVPLEEPTSCRFWPFRKRCLQAYPLNLFWTNKIGQLSLAAMPFHPYCLNIFMSVSTLKVRRFDVEGLVNWCLMEQGEFPKKEFPRHEDVRRCWGRDSQWSHCKGTEYLVANPLFVPGLNSIVASAAVTSDLYNPNGCAFDITVEQAPSTESDPGFGKLPEDIALEIVKYLSGQDIANARLASRRFRRLPISTFRRLVRDEMPFLWEVHSDIPPFRHVRWATNTCAELAQSGIVIPQAVEPFRMRKGPINWHRLYCDLHREMMGHELKGLKNRRRIWHDCEEILRRIEKYREEGIMPQRDYLDLNTLVDRVTSQLTREDLGSRLQNM